MWSTFIKIGASANLTANAELRAHARKADTRLFDDIGVDRDMFTNVAREQMQGRFWRLA